MKLYYHPLSTTSRPVLQFIAENRLDVEYQVVDLFSGEHLKDEFEAVNASRQVPVLEDGDLRLTESSAILKYLGEKFGSGDYPRDLRERAQVNEMMDWFNTGLYRDLGYGFVYPQCLPNHRRPDETLQSSTLDWARERARNWLEVLDRRLIGPEKPYLCGERITIADYFGAALLTIGELVHIDFTRYRNIERWLGNVKARPGWLFANDAFYSHWVAPMKNSACAALQ
jgi:glutathione S-transferase